MLKQIQELNDELKQDDKKTTNRIRGTWWQKQIKEGRVLVQTASSSSI